LEENRRKMPGDADSLMRAWGEKQLKRGGKPRIKKREGKKGKGVEERNGRRK